jgi:hypothetical protein
MISCILIIIIAIIDVIDIYDIHAGCSDNEDLEVISDETGNNTLCIVAFVLSWGAISFVVVCVIAIFIIIEKLV